jgi:hypothetical protein
VAAGTFTARDHPQARAQLLNALLDRLTILEGGGIPAGLWVEKTLTLSMATTTGPVTISDPSTSFTFTPPANGNWECEALLLLQASVATVLPRVTVAVAAQGTASFGAIQIDQTGATTSARVTLDGTWTSTAVSFTMPAGDFPAASTPYLCKVRMRGHSGAAPAPITFQLASETPGTTVTVLVGSQLRYKAT